MESKSTWWIVAIIATIIIVFTMIGMVMWVRSQGQPNIIVVDTPALTAQAQQPSQPSFQQPSQLMAQQPSQPSFQQPSQPMAQLYQQPIGLIRLSKPNGIISFDEVEVGTPPNYNNNIVSGGVASTGNAGPEYREINIVDRTPAYYQSTDIQNPTISILLQDPTPLPLQVRIRNPVNGDWNRAIGTLVQLITPGGQVVTSTTIDTAAPFYIFTFDPR